MKCRINVKLGSINTIPDPQSVSILMDLQNLMIMMGMDLCYAPALSHAAEDGPLFPLGTNVIHPAPGSEGCPLFTTLVRNIDSDTAKYIATCHVQTSQKEIIEDLREMAQHIGYVHEIPMKFQEENKQHCSYLIDLFGGSVSKGQFQEVLDFKLKALQAKCHHVCFFTMNPGDADQSGNCPAGMVIDQVVAHPVEFNCIFQSQQPPIAGLCFMSCLCEVNSLCINSGTCLLYCLHWAKNHYDPQGGINLSDMAMHTDNMGAESALEAYKCNFKPLHNDMTTLMYFS
ncbi:hypothetical protein EDC04DRAFT_2922907 [Pisolithus marmoratus]|nr:hypothetical protein EDC04DRAFT_2922907 [Pisolithus marmoratus]